MLRAVPTLIVALVAFVALAAGAPAARDANPQVIQLPTGFAPEGIEIRGSRFFTGSVANGAIYSGSLTSGQGAILAPGVAGRAATGIEVSKGNRLIVAGAGTGKAYVYNAKTGVLLQEITLASAPTFINDVVVTKNAAYFTDSMKPVLYKVPIGAGGVLGAVQTINLTGDYQHQAGFNLNGIDASKNGKTLVVVQSATGSLFTVNPQTGATNKIELAGGESVPSGDGLLLKGRTLFVVQNQLDRVAVIGLAKDLGSGQVVTRISDPDFVVPTTMDDHGNRLYAVNAKFGRPNPNNTFEVVQFAAPKVKKTKTK
jgi:sugar lactone lactonase YvrE